jgi:6-phosphogluconolactonase (cycloisomerase 2 family)
MKNGHSLGLLTIIAVCIIFAGCNVASYAGGGSSPTPTPPPIPSGDYYVNAGIGPVNQVYGFSTAPVAAGGQPSSLLNSPYTANGNGSTGAAFGMALAGGFLYVVNNPGNNITAFPVNADGSLGSPLTAVSTMGTNSNGICVDPTSKFLVVANTTSNTIESFTIASGVLTPAGSATTSLTSPIACAFSTDSKTVYVSNSALGTGVTAYTVNPTGTLTFLNVSPNGSNNFQGIVATSSAVFAATTAGAGVGLFQIASGGGLLPQGVFPSAPAPIGLALSPNGKYLYVASAAAQGVDVFSVNGFALSHLAGPYQVLTNGLSYVSVNSAGNLLVALSVVDHAVSPFVITSSGTLGFAPQAEYVFGAGCCPAAIVAR